MWIASTILSPSFILLPNKHPYCFLSCKWFDLSSFVFGTTFKMGVESLHIELLACIIHMVTKNLDQQLLFFFYLSQMQLQRFLWSCFAVGVGLSCICVHCWNNCFMFALNSLLPRERITHIQKYTTTGVLLESLLYSKVLCLFVCFTIYACFINL